MLEKEMESIFTPPIATKRKSMFVAGRQTEGKRTEKLSNPEKRRRSAMSDGQQYPTLLVRSQGKCKQGSGSGRNTDSTRRLFTGLRLSTGGPQDKQPSEEEK